MSLLRNDLSKFDFNKWKSFLNDQSQNLSLFMNQCLLGIGTDEEKKKSLSMVQQQLVMLSDECNQYLFKKKSVWSRHPDAQLIKANYLYSLSTFEDILTDASSRYENYYDHQVKITDFNLRSNLPELRHLVHELKLTLQQAEIDQELSNIINRTFIELLKRKNISLLSIAYILEFTNGIRSIQTISNVSLMRFLVKLDFNQPEFFLYRVNLTSEKLLNIHGLHEQQELLLQQREELKDIELNNKFSLHPKQSSLKDDMNDYFAEKVIYIEELLALRRTAMNDQYSSEQAFRIRVGLTVPQLALFFRMQIEKGVLVKEGVTEVFNFVAHHFYTDKALFISSHNLLKRSTDVEFATVLKLWDILLEMLEWLDENFSVKNYQRSLT